MTYSCIAGGGGSGGSGEEERKGRWGEEEEGRGRVTPLLTVAPQDSGGDDSVQSRHCTRLQPDDHQPTTLNCGGGGGDITQDRSR